MPATVPQIITGAVAEGAVQAVPSVKSAVRDEVDEALHSRAARLSGMITGAVLFTITYGLMHRTRKLARIEQKLDGIEEEIGGIAEAA